MAKDGVPSGNAGKGRKKGSRNFATLEREAAAVAAAGRAAGELATLNTEDSKKLRQGKDILSRLANYYYDLHLQQTAEKDRAHYAKLAGDFAAKVAPYESARLSAVSLTRHWDLTKLTEAELNELERLSTRAGITIADSAGEDQTRH